MNSAASWTWTDFRDFRGFLKACGDEGVQVFPDITYFERPYRVANVPRAGKPPGKRATSFYDRV
jgi:hypothetical protein